MAQHNDLGKEGEKMAAEWFQKNGYYILEKNWRCGELEIDIIARKNKMLHFIEVKTRHYSSNGHPEDSVTKRKFKNLQKASDIYLLKNPGHRWIQYDVLAITLFAGKEPEYFLLADVFL